MIDKQRAADLKKLGDTGKRGRPQPKPKDLKTDAPGGSTSPGFTKKRTPKYEPEPTTARPSSPAKSGEARTTPMTTEEVENFLQSRDSSGARPDSKARTSVTRAWVLTSPRPAQKV